MFNSLRTRAFSIQKNPLLKIKTYVDVNDSICFWNKWTVVRTITNGFKDDDLQAIFILYTEGFKYAVYLENYLISRKLMTSDVSA